MYGTSARAIYELGRRYNYEYVYHMVFSDIFLVRSDLLDEKYRGMRLEDTYDGYPLHYVDLDMN